ARLKQLSAEEARKAETVRADAVKELIMKLLQTTAPELLLQGHQRPVRDLLQAADQFAGSALSNAPAAEFHVRGLMGMLYVGDGPSLLDAAACYQQVKRINELLPRVPDAQLGAPRDLVRIGVARSSLWAGNTQEGLAQFQALKAEFQQRSPPA